MENGQKWAFYRANELDLPTMTELKGLKSLIIWSSTSSPTLKDSEDASYPSWVRPVLKLIKSAYSQFPSLKILGIQAGSHLLAQAFGGKIERKEMNETQKIMHNQSKGLFCGRDQIRLKETFYELDCVKHVFPQSLGVIRLPHLNVFSIYETGL
jgi:GMP synthase-like glutamine amidotransferase